MDPGEFENGLAIDGKEANAFWEKVRSTDCDSPDAYCLWDLLVERGWEPPDPDDVNAEELPAEIKRLVMDLAWVHAYLNFTDHLPDREFYERLYEKVYTYNHWIYPDDSEAAVSINMLADGQEEHTLYLRYYADEASRTLHGRGEEKCMPPSEPSPYPRPWVPERPFFEE